MLLQQPLPFTVLKLSSIKIKRRISTPLLLQQPLPFTVLKLSIAKNRWRLTHRLQQPLPFTVLKRDLKGSLAKESRLVATALTVYGIETAPLRNFIRG